MPIPIRIEMTNPDVVIGPPSGLVSRLRNALSFPNPKFTENSRRGFSTWNVPHNLCYLDAEDGTVSFPQGFARHAIGIIRQAGTSSRFATIGAPCRRLISCPRGRCAITRRKRYGQSTHGTSGRRASPPNRGKRLSLWQPSPSAGSLPLWLSIPAPPGAMD